jgi:Fe-S oxidoreductase/nitrate reductase gamma subunit
MGRGVRFPGISIIGPAAPWSLFLPLKPFVGLVIIGERRIDLSVKVSGLTRLTASLALSLMILWIPPPGHARESFALRLAGSTCTPCHSDPRTGALNEEGLRFMERGYRYPFSWGQAGSWGLGLALVLMIPYGLFRRSGRWRIGRRDEKWDQFRERWKGLLIDGLVQRKVLKRRCPGMSHGFLFWAMILLALGVVIILFQEYVILPLLGTRLIDSVTYPWFRLFLDLAGFTGWTGTVLLAWRRYIQKPQGLDNQPADAIALVLLGLAFSTGLLTTGLRNQLYASPWSSYSPFASSTARLFTLFISDPVVQKKFLRGFWWGHLLFSSALLFSIPAARLLHLAVSPLSIFFRNLKPKGTLSTIDLEASETYGVDKIEEFTWKHLVELDACTRCGRCQETCPAYLTQKHLNPKKVIQNLRQQLERSYRTKEEASLIGDVVTEDEIWECTTCRNCLEHCPVSIEPMVKLIELRRNLALNRGKIPRETHFAFRNIERKGNPWGFEPEKRMGWIQEMGVREVLPGEEVDLLFWVGCYSSYDDRNIQVAKSFIQIMDRAGLKVGVLGNREWCCGTDLRRMGSEYLYQITVDRVAEALRAIRFRKIVTTCPHCFNTFKNEYPQFGVRYDVIHYPAMLDQLLQEGRVTMKPEKTGPRVTYHDSCYLGRYNDGFEPPRNILRSLPGVEYSEMERSREQSFCCGGGGCHMWMEEKAGRRINEARVLEARETGASILATVCPLCLTSLDSAVKVLSLDAEIQVKDILEVVKERMAG